MQKSKKLRLEEYFPPPVKRLMTCIRTVELISPLC